MQIACRCRRIAARRRPRGARPLYTAPRTAASLEAADAQVLWHPYTSALAPSKTWAVRSAAGTRLTLESGASLVDGMSSWWAAVHGYRVPELDAAAADQLGRMSHVMFGGLTHRPAVELAERLLAAAPAPLARVFFSDSGSVAVEVAIKMALQFWAAQGRPQRHRLLTVRGGYHGDTFGAMAVCDPESGMHAAMFERALPRHLFAPPPPPLGSAEAAGADGGAAPLRALLDAHADEVAAVILEPLVQGAGGMRFYAPAYVRAVREACDAHDVLFIADEIATGFGRTGGHHLFACDAAGAAPDILCLGKALTGGYMTLGATLATDRVARGVSGGGGGGGGGSGGAAAVPLMHGPTFMANPLACAVAVASFDKLTSADYGWAARVDRIGRGLRGGLEGCAAHSDVVADVRTLGAIGVVEMREPLGQWAQDALVERGVWLRPFGKLLYAMPPFVSTDNDIETVTGAMREVVEMAAARGREE